MGRVRSEALQFGKRSFKSREGVVEYGGEPAKLIVRDSDSANVSKAIPK